MAVLQALRPAVGALGRNPVLLIVTAAFSVLQIPGFVAQSIDPLLGSVVSIAFSGLLVLVMPLYLGGVVGMANEALDGSTSLATFLRAGKSHYVSLFVVYLALLAVNFVLGIGGFFVALVGGVTFFAGGGQPNVLALAILGVVVLLVLLAYVLLVFVTQFFAHAVVVDDLGAVAGVKRSAWCVRHNLLSVVGYTLLVGAGSAVFGLVVGLYSILTTRGVRPGPTEVETPAAQFATSLPTLGPVAAIGVGLVVLGLTAVAGAFFATYSTAFYRRIRPAA
jgi:hypothetical protein